MFQIVIIWIPNCGTPSLLNSGAYLSIGIWLLLAAFGVDVLFHYRVRFLGGGFETHRGLDLRHPFRLNFQKTYIFQCCIFKVLYSCNDLADYLNSNTLCMCVRILNVPMGGNLHCLTSELELDSWQGAHLFSSVTFSRPTQAFIWWVSSCFWHICFPYFLLKEKRIIMCRQPLCFFDSHKSNPYWS